MISVQIALTVLTILVIFVAERNYSCRLYIKVFCHNSVLCVLFNVSPEVTCKHVWSLCWVGSMNVELERQKRNKGLCVVNKINASCDCYGQIGLFC